MQSNEIQCYWNILGESGCPADYINIPNGRNDKEAGTCEVFAIHINKELLLFVLFFSTLSFLY